MFKYLVRRIDGNASRAIIKQDLGRSYALSWKPCQGDSLNPPDHSEGEFITTCSCSNDKDILSIKIQESRKFNHKDKVFRKLWYTRSSSRFQVYQGRLLASFQDDAKCEHGGQDTRLQGGKNDQDKRIKI
nr:hypothetical protein [Tanacetum cinerariifolium]